MHRIAAAMLIAITALAFNGSLLRDVAAAETVARVPAPAVETIQPAIARNAKVLSLLRILETLRQSPVALDTQKV